ncbi:MAG: hypothetical protein M0C28_42260 [Candidatus Moduliflexus flocculans]|nr:hypothetical protein [Candidatus Moduliflexus flocculans]
MIGVPGETRRDRRADASRPLLGIEPDHVSVYFLENVEGLPFEQVLDRRPVDEDAAVDRLRDGQDALEAAGLRRYEISNFARAGKECRHNLKYWRYEPFIGLGPVGLLPCRRQALDEPADLEEWAGAVRRGAGPRARRRRARRRRPPRARPSSSACRLVEGRRPGRTPGTDGRRRVHPLRPGDRRARFRKACSSGTGERLRIPRRQAPRLQRHPVPLHLKEGVRSSHDLSAFSARTSKIWSLMMRAAFATRRGIKSVVIPRGKAQDRGR